MPCVSCTGYYCYIYSQCFILSSLVGFADARELTLDPNTANNHLILSEGNRKLMQGPDEQPYVDHAERFEFFKQVMCQQGLSGRSYWEAEWTGGNVVIAMSYKDIPRKGGKGNCVFGSNNKSWKLDCSSDSYTAHHNKQKTDIPAPAFRSNRVGVYLDQPAGVLSFYSISTEPHTQTHLHTYYANFLQPLYAGFWVDINTSVHLCLME